MAQQSHKNTESQPKSNKFHEHVTYNVTQKQKTFCQNAIIKGFKEGETRLQRLQIIQKLIANKYGNPVIVVESKDSYQWAPDVIWGYIVTWDGSGYNYNINCYNRGY
eukprot:199932_1